MKWKRVEKRIARKMYEQGKAIYCLPSKMNPYSIWVQPCLMPNEASYLGKDVPPKEWVRTFDQAYNSFSYYNCNEEQGKFVKFYIKEV